MKSPGPSEIVQIPLKVGFCCSHPGQMATDGPNGPPYWCELVALREAKEEASG